MKILLLLIFILLSASAGAVVLFDSDGKPIRQAVKTSPYEKAIPGGCWYQICAAEDTEPVPDQIIIPNPIIRVR